MEFVKTKIKIFDTWLEEYNPYEDIFVKVVEKAVNDFIEDKDVINIQAMEVDSELKIIVVYKE